MATKASVAIVKKFLAKDAKDIPSSEMLGFWKACSEEERIQFTEESAKLLGEPIPEA